MNIATLLRRVAADHAGQVALRLDEDELRYAHLGDTAARFAAHLRAEGAAPGDRVGFFLPNALEYVSGLLGVWQAGGVAVPLNYLFPDAALRHAILDSGATHLVADRPTCPGWRGCWRRRSRCSPPGRTALGTQALAGNEPSDRVEPRLDGDDARHVHVGVHRRAQGRAADASQHDGQVEAVIEVFDLTAEDHALLPMPLFHVGGLQLGTLPILMRGGQVTFMAKWDAVAWIALAQRLRPTYGGLISTMLIDVGNRTAGARCCSIRSGCSCSAGRGRRPPIERLTAGIGVEPVEIYGQTEQSGLAVTYPLGARRRPGSTGVPRSRPCRPGSYHRRAGRTSFPARTTSASCGCAATRSAPATGTVPTRTRRSGAMAGSHRRPRLARADGYLYYVDRIDDMIVTGGENVFPQIV